MIAGIPDLPDGCRNVLIAGPTASGKSAVALRIARSTGGIVVNADALQVYDCWQVLTARPSAEDESRAEHALYGHVDYRTRYSVGRWLREVAELLERHAGRVLIFTGGSGLYLTCLVNGMAPIPPVGGETRVACDERLQEGGPKSLLDDLLELDPETAAGLDHDNPARIRRAWEVFMSSGRGLSEWHREIVEPLVDLESALAIVIEMDRDALVERIERRLAIMASGGAIDECRHLRQVWDPSLPASRALGASEFMAHIDGEISLDEALDRASVATRQYAKRQRTWFRNRMGKDWLRVEMPACG